MTSNTVRAGPPGLPLALTVGVTGHRRAAIDPKRGPQIAQEIGVILDLIEQSMLSFQARMAGSGAFDEGPPTITLASPLADGADQIAAQAAIERGWRLQAILPFAREEYQRDFEHEDPAQVFEDLLTRADCVLELPGSREEEPAAYLLAGRATVAHCDILVALWDGAPPRGRGGTAEIVENAVVAGVPVVHVPVQPDRETTMLWTAFDPQVMTRSGYERAIRRPFNRERLDFVIEGMIGPPGDNLERFHYQEFRCERPPRFSARIEFPLLLSLAGVRRLRIESLRDSDCRRAIADEWDNYRRSCLSCQGTDAPLDLLEQAYAWSDRLASHYAQTFRSGHVFNFVLAATAALIGLSAFLAPQHQLMLAIAEFLVASAVIANTLLGSKREWQRRWLDYRQLAERLRPMRSLKMLGVAAPDNPASRTDPLPRRWVEWYAAGLWRAMGCPAGRLEQDSAAKLIATVRELEVDSQIAYNERAAFQAEQLDTRLGRLFNILFIATLITALAIIIGKAVSPDWVAAHQNWLSLISTGLPATATAVFGIRSQGDFAGSAQRSQSTAQTLKAIASHLDEEAGDLSRSADLIEQAARAMLQDLEEWRLVIKRSELEMV
ncbi:DUF4231 domain-containing protein [Sphingomonas sp. HDW15A]|uniref:DUF4231 domain-containing protein n=1 Tax=Sphingomonas sp. HDW15A TaxID=2714942 RepID=UPI00140BA17A|nr:DUF4231 domain-containing protein [Sphingomonas sp. HDW15A]QIK97042.1 DUF4231 domain-containing protein [Sphingomonas sp. HDW15A]